MWASKLTSWPCLHSTVCTGDTDFMHTGLVPVRSGGSQNEERIKALIWQILTKDWLLGWRGRISSTLLPPQPHLGSA